MNKYTCTKYTYLILLLVFSGSCTTFHHGDMDSSASLSKNNFKIIGQTKGSARVDYILGIGGNNKEALTYEAKKDLYRNVTLQKGQKQYSGKLAGMNPLKAIIKIENDYKEVYSSTLKKAR